MSFMITFLLLVTFIGVNYCIFSRLEKTIHNITLLDGIVTGLTISLSGSYVLYLIIAGLTSQTIFLLTTILALEAVLLGSLTLGGTKQENKAL